MTMIRHSGQCNCGICQGGSEMESGCFGGWICLCSCHSEKREREENEAMEAEKLEKARIEAEKVAVVVSDATTNYIKKVINFDNHELAGGYIKFVHNNKDYEDYFFDLVPVIKKEEL